MSTVVLEVGTLKDTLAEASLAMKMGAASSTSGESRIVFAAPELLWQVLTAKRWEILKALCGAGPISIRETARRVGRDVKAVHRDVTALAQAGLLDRSESGGVEFPYDAVKVDILLKAA